MFRSTVSRVKKVCSVALIPRILRGDQCGVSVTNAAVRKAFKSTNSADDGNHYYTLETEDNVEKKSDEAASLGKTLAQTSEPLFTSSLPLTERERCQKIIDKAFGNCEHTPLDQEVREQYYSHSVNLEEARREIFEAEERLKLEENLHLQHPLRVHNRQYAIFNMSHQLDDHDEILQVSISEVHPATRGPNLDEDVESYVNDPESLENKGLRDDDAKTIEMDKDERRKYVHQKAISQEKIQTLLPYSKTQFGVYSLTREGDSSADPEILKEPTLEILVDSEDLNKNFATNSNEDFEKCINLESVERKTFREKDLIKHMFINATTAKADEEQLTQKLETIEETPIVEAQKPKLEGFNVTPKVLGDKSALGGKSIENNQDNYSRVDLSSNLDNVAKRCLNSPLGQIDKMLLKEMEKLPYTHKTESQTPLKSHLRHILVQMKDLKQQKYTSDIGQKKTPYESRKHEEEDDENPPVEKLCITRLSNPSGRNKEASKGVHRPSHETVKTTSNHAMHGQQLQEPCRNVFCSRNLYGPHISDHKQQNASAPETNCLLQKGETDHIELGQTPQDQPTEEEGEEHKHNTKKKELEREPYANFRLPDHKWYKQTEQLPKGDKATTLCTPEKSYLTELRQEYGKDSLTDEFLKKHKLDPYYVLACNETCPIAPLSTMSTITNSDFEDITESLRMIQNNRESRRSKQLLSDLMMTNEYMSENKQALHKLDRELEPEIIPELQYTAMPWVERKGTRDAVQKLPSLSDDVSLSELLRRVRQRNRLECITDLKAMGFSVSPTVGKCPRRAPRCPPTAPRSPPNNPVPPPSFGLPMLKVPRTDTLLPCRSFYKTEWPKPKFVNKPYTTKRENTSGLEDVAYEETKAQPYIKRTERIVSEQVLKREPTTKFAKAPYPNVQIPNCCHIDKRVPATFFALNLGPILNPPTASLAYIFVRYFTTDTENTDGDIFWKPKVRIPDENEMIKRLRDPDPEIRKEAEREAKYLFLNYGQKQNASSDQGNSNPDQDNSTLDHGKPTPDQDNSTLDHGKPTPDQGNTSPDQSNTPQPPSMPGV